MTDNTRGVTLIEAVLAIALVGVVLAAVGEMTLNIDRLVIEARNTRLATVLANQILARECLGNYPEGVGDDRGVDHEIVDEEQYGPGYEKFTYSVEKSIQELVADSDASETDEDGRIQPPELEPGEEESEELPATAQVLRIKVTVHFQSYNFSSGGMQEAELVVETFIRPIEIVEPVDESGIPEAPQ